MRAAITSLAKFHAIGISIKHKAPEFLPRIEKFSKTMLTGLDEIRHVIDMMLTAIKGDPEIGQLYERIKATCDPDELSTYYTELAVDHPWACVVHADFWLNNALMHKNAEGHVDDCKLVDFQTYYTSSPLTDLVFLLCTSLRLPHDEDFDELVETYRAEAARVLTKLDCPEALELFTTEKFDERLRLDATAELLHVIEMSKIVEQREGEVYEESPPNEHTMSRLQGGPGLLDLVNSRVRIHPRGGLGVSRITTRLAQGFATMSRARLPTGLKTAQTPDHAEGQT
ncbi:unnamed protein product [Trichogramma brassicae]|uniref:CHK kinase-like domain-containing protein n=1 Tax=Trichogramma brassicae TaxID=86971 RepID=A0A6H5INI0_9HYME|nr:unnamed protein product [Trichogramma brassicae]